MKKVFPLLCVCYSDIAEIQLAEAYKRAMKSKGGCVPMNPMEVLTGEGEGKKGGAHESF